MRLVPPLFSQVHGLSWRAAITPAAFQRLNLRLLVLVVAGMTLLAMAAVGATLSARLMGANPDAVSGIAGSVYLLITMLGMGWVVFAIVKLYVLRMRALGMSTRGAVATVTGIALCMLLAGLAASARHEPLMLFAAGLPLETYRYLPLVQLLAFIPAYYSYLTYFEEASLRPVAAPVAEPLPAAPSRFESFALFLLQTWVLYTILGTPLHIIFNY